ncbi:MAG: hypothetical protein MI922_17885 [Bacteroidales bacterium]|nr:hypothetical protein [Bacteroidales bacterium]
MKKISYFILAIATVFIVITLAKFAVNGPAILAAIASITFLVSLVGSWMVSQLIKGNTKEGQRLILY